MQPPTMPVRAPRASSFGSLRGLASPSARALAVGPKAFGVQPVVEEVAQELDQLPGSRRPLSVHERPNG